MSDAPKEPFGMPRSVVDPKAGRGPSRRAAMPSPTRSRERGSEGHSTGNCPAQVEIPLERLVGLPVLAEDGEQVGTVADVVLNDSLTTVLGVDLTAVGERRTHFLPWFLLRAGAGELTVPSKAELVRRSVIGSILGRGRRLSDRPAPSGGVVTPVGDIRLR